MVVANTAGVTYRRSPAVEETIVGDRAVLYHRVSGEAVVLNRTASILWEQLSTERDSRNLEQVLIDLFPRVDRLQIEQDVQACLADLADSRLISTHRDASPTHE